MTATAQTTGKLHVEVSLWQLCHHAIRVATANERHVAKRWARWLDRSPRTVEAYLDGTSLPRLDDAIRLAARCDAFESELLNLIRTHRRFLRDDMVSQASGSGFGEGGKQGAS